MMRRADFPLAGKAPAAHKATGRSGSRTLGSGTSQPRTITWPLPSRATTAGWFRMESYMDLGLDGKVALVAASSKGLGKASALALAREGARVTICARSEPLLRSAADEIRGATGAEVLAVAADLRTAAGITSVVTATAERFGSIDVLVNNSGGPALGTFWNFTDDDWRQAFEVTILNFVRFLREVVPYMRQRRVGPLGGVPVNSVEPAGGGIRPANGARPGSARAA